MEGFLYLWFLQETVMAGSDLQPWSQYCQPRPPLATGSAGQRLERALRTPAVWPAGEAVMLHTEVEGWWTSQVP